jgi:diacylglycerol diphosphate phosphatase/phosphatidate phosphatase
MVTRTVILLISCIILFTINTEPVKHTFRITDASISYELKNATIPYYIVIMIGVVYMILITMSEYIQYRNYITFKRRVMYYITGITESILIVILITGIVKLSVGRLRPDFLNRCFGDDYIDVIRKMKDILYTRDICETFHSTIEGSKSFFSGHTSTMFAYSPIMTVYILKTLNQKDFKGSTRYRVDFMRSIITLIALAPMVFALYVGITRITDNKHHYSDVTMGIVVGTMSSCSYLYDVAKLDNKKDDVLLDHDLINCNQVYTPLTF